MQDISKFRHDFQNELQKLRSIVKLLLDEAATSPDTCEEREELIRAGNTTLNQINESWKLLIGK